jgi:hypothetical protein
MAELLKAVRYFLCNRCGFEWQARGATPPAQCRRCHARDWNSPVLKVRVAKPLRPLRPQFAKPVEVRPFTEESRRDARRAMPAPVFSPR